MTRKQKAQRDGESLRFARVRQRLTQAELARRVGVSGASVAAYELGQRSMSPEIRGRLLAALAGTDPDLPGAA
ncbi:MAG: helix-turn-helix domain-containing protein [Acidobacteria bacterium]|nr:helix-turn-helix domain-containing protein [Acidobacteriota bacterium]